MRFFIFLLCLSLPLLAEDGTSPASLAVNKLGIELLPLAAKANENALISPYSIQSALAMTFAGADGETRKEMARVLHFSEDTIASFASLQVQLSEIEAKTRALAEDSQRMGAKSDPITLRVANRLFGQKGYAFRPEFLSLVKQKFDAPLEQLDFQANPDAAAKLINAWVEKQTRDRIKDLIPPRALDDLTRLVLVNAIYLKAPWATPFSVEATSPLPFYLADSTKADVPTMMLSESLGYERTKHGVAVALPYLGNDLQLLVLIPSNSMASFEKSLTAEFLKSCANLPERKVSLFLPKWKLQPPVLALADTLQSLGMKTAFDIPRGSANFEGIAPRRGTDYLYISNVFHKTFMAVDEKGTEAAAATAVVMMSATMLVETETPIEVRVDRPFIFAIQHRPSGACLFLGRLMDPRP